MVRLKAHSAEFINDYAAKFQFLMVRLKASTSKIEVQCTTISIPYGAIKRKFSKTKLQTFVKFQFLMVRLKVSFPELLSSVKTISIPYGAIKS